MSTTELADLGVVEAAEGIASRAFTATELLESTLSAARRADPGINAIIWLDEESAYASARVADERVAAGGPLGSLHGLPLAHKDLFLQAGKRCTIGSGAFRERLATSTATAVARLAGAGAYSYAGLNMAEFALNPTGHNHYYGHVRNPWSRDHVPGGSSSGSAAAVAARYVLASLGTDTGGSIRVPASACGVTGLKPTQTLVSRHGVAPSSSFSYETVGPIARSARDVARLLSVIAGHDSKDSTTSRLDVPRYEAALDGDLRGQRIGVFGDGWFATDDHRIRQAVDDGLAVLAGRGAQLVTLPAPDLTRINAYSAVIVMSEVASAYRGIVADPNSDISDLFRSRLLAAQIVPASYYVTALSQRGAALKDFLDTVFASVDAIAVPTIHVPLPELSQSDIDDGDEAHAETAMALSRNARPFNYLGLPALTVPVCAAAQDLPVGLQLVGRPFSELRLLKIGDALQRDTDWHRLKPSELAASNALAH